MYLHDGHEHIDCDAGGGDGSEDAQNERDATEKLSESRDIPEPVGKSQVRDKLCEVVEGAVGNDLAPAVGQHDGAEDEPRDERGKRAQVFDFRVQICLSVNE